MAVQKTYTMIKPDGVRNGHIGEIVNRFERAGLTIERMELGMVTDEQAKACLLYTSLCLKTILHLAHQLLRDAYY